MFVGASQGRIDPDQARDALLAITLVFAYISVN
jgi:hypothetical protein